MNQTLRGLSSAVSADQPDGLVTAGVPDAVEAWAAIRNYIEINCPDGN